MSKIKFLVLFMLFLESVAFCFTPAQIAQAKVAVAQNPSLLNSPQAKQFLQQHQINNTTTTQHKSNLKVENKIDLSSDKKDTSTDNNDQQEQQNINEIKTSTQTTHRLNPLRYKSNNELLDETRSFQSKVHKNRLQRFSTLFFRNKNEINPNNIVAPKNYIINKGDIVTFWVYGATNRKEELKVDARGNINIPQVGPVHIAGEKFGEVKDLLTNYLSSSYKNSQVVVDLNSFSTAQVTITGFVKAPGIYNTTSVSSVKDILMQAGGVADVGSVRKIEILRNGQLIDTIDYYHLLTQGQDHGDSVLQAGDVIHIPRAYGLIAIDGEVNTPAIYEIEPGETLRHILQFAGGLKAIANGKKIYLKRYNRHTNVEYKTLTLRQASNLITKDGDEIYVGKLDKNNERYIEVSGNVVDPGKKYIGHNSIKLSTFLRKQLRGRPLDTFFLTNTKLDYALVKRIDKTLTPKIYHVNIDNILHKREDFTLHNKDILYIFNKLDTQVNPYVTIQEVNSTQKSNLTKTKLLMQTGQFQYTKGMTLKDLINMAGTNGVFDATRVKIVSYDTSTKSSKISLINYEKNPNYQLKPFDTVFVYNVFETNPLKTARIQGEILKPGNYPIEDGMTLEKFIQSAGGLTQRAYSKNCEIIRYNLENGERKKKIFNINLEEANNFIVQEFDEINVKRVPYWSERKTVTIKGEVKFPGTYNIQTGEKLSSLIKRAGGYTEDAFLYGAVFTRKEIAVLQKKSLQRSLSKLKEQVILASLRASGSKTMGSISITEGISAVQSLISDAQKLTPIGRISINLDCDIDSLAGSASDLTLKDGDTLTIPSHNDTVVVSGEVMNPMALTYLGDNIKSYINQTGGLTEIADSDHIYVLHANGQAQKASLGSYLFSSNNVNVKKGDVIIVPKKIMFERGIDIAGDIADIIYKITLTVAALNTVGAL